jgi:hypothetical protein
MYSICRSCDLSSGQATQSSSQKRDEPRSATCRRATFITSTLSIRPMLTTRANLQFLHEKTRLDMNEFLTRAGSPYRADWLIISRELMTVMKITYYYYYCRQLRNVHPREASHSNHPPPALLSLQPYGIWIDGRENSRSLLGNEYCLQRY